MTFTYAIIVAILLFICIPIVCIALAPSAVFIAKTVNSRKPFKYHLSLVTFVIAVILARLADLSLANHILNIVVIILAVAVSALLSAHLFQIRPKFLGYTLGTLTSIAIGLVALIILIYSVIFGLSPRTVAIENNLYCRGSLSGIADEEDITEVFKRYLFIDKLVVRNPSESSEIRSPTALILLNQCKSILLFDQNLLAKYNAEHQPHSLLKPNSAP